MKFEINNLGIVNQASLELGDLTILCGKNNAGKSYLTHSLYGFLQLARESTLYNISQSQLRKLIEGELVVEFAAFKSEIENRCEKLAEKYSPRIHQLLTGGARNYVQQNSQNQKSTQFRFDLDLTHEKLINCVKLLEKNLKNYDIKVVIDYSKKQFRLVMDPNKIQIKIPNELQEENDQSSRTPRYLKNRHRKLRFTAREIDSTITDKLFPRTFIASAERSGIMHFQKEVDFTRSRILEALDDGSSEKLDLRKLPAGISFIHPRVVRDNLDFFRALPDITKQKSKLVKLNSTILDNFQDILGGAIKITQDGDVLLQPLSNSDHYINYSGTSGSVKNLLYIGAYIKHLASPGDLLIIDEPELGLHPENQRRIARFFAQLINAGIKVFITTHSDYIIKELNTLIMLSQKDEPIQKIRQKYNYSDEELLETERLKVYVMQNDKRSAELGLIFDPSSNDKGYYPQVLAAANVNKKDGIEIIAFDQTINIMNKIYDEIIWRK